MIFQSLLFERDTPTGEPSVGPIIKTSINGPTVDEFRDRVNLLCGEKNRYGRVLQELRGMKRGLGVLPDRWGSRTHPIAAHYALLTPRSGRIGEPGATRVPGWQPLRNIVSFRTLRGVFSGADQSRMLTGCREPLVKHHDPLSLVFAKR